MLPYTEKRAGLLLAIAWHHEVGAGPGYVEVNPTSLLGCPKPSRTWESANKANVSNMLFIEEKKEHEHLINLVIP